MAQGCLPLVGASGQTVDRSDEDRPAYTTTQEPRQPSELGRFLQDLVDGPVLDPLKPNRGKKSELAKRHKQWLDAKKREDYLAANPFKKFPEIPE
jgi:hypothetical protein